MKKLCILLTDPLKIYYDKGEIKERYYNPCNYFDEVHVISFCKNDIEEDKVKQIVGNAFLKIYPVGKLTFFSLLLMRYKLLGLVKRIKPDIIRAYDPSLRGALAVYVAKKINLPVVISLHYHPDDQRKFDSRILIRLRIILEHYVLKNATKVICVTNYVKSYVEKYRAKNTVVVYNRVDPDQFKPDVDEYYRDNKLILSVGRLDQPKYQECLIRAVENLDVRLMLIGSGKMYSYLKRLCCKLNVVDKVIFMQSVPNSDIQKYYRSCIIFALATHYEGFCIPILEAMASGIPVVASDIPSIREIGQGAIKLVPNNPEFFRNAFLEIIDNEKKKNEMSSSGLEVVKNRFDYHILENSEKLAYESLIY